MSRFISFLIIILIAAIFGVFIVQEQGVMIITISGYMIQTPLWYAIIAVIIAVFLIIFVIKVVSGTLSTPFVFFNFFAKRKRNKAFAQLKNNIMADITLDHAKIKIDGNNYKSLNKDQLTETALLLEGNALLVKNKLTKLRIFLNDLDEQYKENEYFLWLLSQLELKEGEPNLAHAILMKAKLSYPKSRLIYRALINYNLNYNYPVEVLPLLEEANHHRLFSNEENKKLYTLAYVGGLNNLCDADEVALKQFWQVVPSEYKKNTKVYHAYINALIEVDQQKDAEELIKKALKKQYNADFIKLWLKLENVDAMKRFEYLENLFGKEVDLLNNDIKLLYAKAALISNQNEKARLILEKLPENKEVLALLAKVYDVLSMPQQSIIHYQKALAL